MNGTNSIQANRIAAAILLVVFLFIQVGKALHTHNHLGREYAVKASQELKQSSECAICDFHFSKDCDSETALIQLPSMIGFALYRCHYKSFLTASIGLSYSDRGPPMQAC